ncbi:unnamed protein product [Prorocentrum cordatum]|uniref:Uncharacterized protein n=1 Tax=Prorocentrum cordatum TaxID=2364126 RepID=A0ABN9UWK4_9DINO|nr:unnamed protein product [Polarella glacialis]
MGLEWLKPAHLLELAVKTPPNRRTPLMGRCAEQLQRGMVVSVADALGLSLELMTSARCKTNGYVLDFPPVRPEDSEAVAAFVQRVRDLSGSATVDWEAFLRDEVQLPPLAPEPEPPEPPAEEGEGEEEGGGEGGDATAEDDAAEGGEEEEEEEGGEAAAGGAGAADEPPAGGPGEGAEGEAGGEAAEGEAEPREEQEGSPDGEEGPAEPPPPPPPVLVPNPLANSMPRRLLVLSAETDELAGWKQVLLKLQHEEKARRRKELEAAGEEVEDEDAEEEEAAEQPALPEEEEEREELFDKNAGDVLRTMAEFVPAPPLEQPKALPPIPEVSLDPQPEPADDEALAKGHEDAVRILHVDQEVPLLSLRADGRPPSEVADLLEVAAGQLRCPRAPLPKMLEGEGAEEPKELLRLDLDEKQVSRRWSQWRQHCPVALYDKRLVPGGKEFAAEYAGYAFCFSSAAAQRRFCAWPKLFLTDAPRINAPGMHLGYVLLSPMGFRVPELAARVSERYGFDVVDVAALVQRAVQLKASDQPPLPPQEVEGEGGQERPRTPAPEEDEEEPGAPRLLVAEKAALLAGAPLGAETLARLVGEALGIAKNTAILQKQQDDIAEAKRVLEEFAAREPPEDAEEGDAGPAAPEYELDEEGEPVIPLSEPLLVPPRGFVLTGFPGSAEQLELLRSKLRLEIERVLVVKPMAEEEPKEPAEILAELGFGQDAPMESHLESQAAGFESLAALEDLQLSDVAMEATEDEQFIQIQKAIDPFYEVADDAEVADEIPDPDEWEEPPAEEPEEGEPPPDPLELPRRPTIPWGVCGPYCPVTLKEDDWLFPGQKANQHMYKNKVYALANEAASAKFVAEPSKYVPSSGEPPIPRVRVLVTGPTGSGVERQCQLLAEACKMPVVKVEGEWRARVEARLQAARAAVKEAAAAEKLLEPLLADEGVAWPPGWTPPEPKPEA